MKLKSFYTAKETIKMKKRQSQDGRKSSAQEAVTTG